MISPVPDRFALAGAARARAPRTPMVWTRPANRLPLRRAAAVAADLCLRALIGFALVIALAVTIPSLVWHATFCVLSGSMTPTLRVGDVVVDKRIPPLDARIGDVVTFRDPENPSRLYTHRVVSMRASGGVVSFVTRGDANTGVEHWAVPVDGSIGRAVYHVPLVGYAADRIGSRLGRLALIVVPVLLLAFFELRRIWRRDGEDGSDAVAPS